MIKVEMLPTHVSSFCLRCTYLVIFILCYFTDNTKMASSQRCSLFILFLKRNECVYVCKRAMCMHLFKEIYSKVHYVTIYTYKSFIKNGTFWPFYGYAKNKSNVFLFFQYPVCSVLIQLILTVHKFSDEQQKKEPYEKTSVIFLQKKRRDFPTNFYEQIMGVRSLFQFTGCFFRSDVFFFGFSCFY